MALIVQKYGGSSVGTLERIKHVASKVMQAKQQGHDVVVVVSAMQGETDRLIQLAQTLTAELDAQECQIFTYVDGVFTTDPRLIPEASLLTHISFEEMLEMASLGAKVLQMRSVELASEHNIPIRVLSTFSNNQTGTLVTF